MNEKLLADYITAAGLSAYKNSKIEEIDVIGKNVHFSEVDPVYLSVKHHKVGLLDLIAWVHSKNKGEE